jgi:hypothetical protein
MKGSVGGSTTFLTKLNTETKCLMPKCKRKAQEMGYCYTCIGDNNGKK